MTQNITRTYKLVEEIPPQDWLANPTSRQGYETILLEKVNSGGSRYYCSLKSGETLSLGEHPIGKFIFLTVDISQSHSILIDEEFYTIEADKKMKLRAKVNYQVVDAKVVALDIVDPLGELYNKVVATLRHEISNYKKNNITIELIKMIIVTIGQLPHLGLAVEKVEILDFVL